MAECSLTHSYFQCWIKQSDLVFLKKSPRKLWRWNCWVCTEKLDQLCQLEKYSTSVRRRENHPGFDLVSLFSGLIFFFRFDYLQDCFIFLLSERLFSSLLLTEAPKPIRRLVDNCKKGTQLILILKDTQRHIKNQIHMDKQTQYLRKLDDE